jgi:16S rRNA (guanine527-N7)-methyltransferase
MTENQVSASYVVGAFQKKLQEPLRLLGIEGVQPSENVAAQLEAFCALMLKWNASLNITGAKSVGDLAQEHLPDAFVLSKFIPQGSRIVDVGTGGGLPALPLAILRADLGITMVEPRAKRVAFLRTAIRELSLKGCQSWVGRIEDWRPESGFPEVAISRATFAPEEWLPIGMGLVQPGGRVYALLNERWESESLAGFRVSGQHHYGLTRGQTRTLAWFDKA